MKIIVTCGPSSEPIDEVRKITNVSTGELGVLLADELSCAGFEVFCLKGLGSIHKDPNGKCQVTRFDTNDELLDLLTQASRSHEFTAVFHTAALCDYKVKQVEDEQGRLCSSPKIASRSGVLTINLEPATKIISQMRTLFPHSVIVGWKYELAGTKAEAFEKAWCQIKDNDIDACVLNGRAYGSGFGFFHLASPVHECTSKLDLARFLSDWLLKRITI